MAWSEQTQRDAARARHNRKNVNRILSSRFDKWTHRRIAVHVEDCLGGLVLNGGDKDGGDLLTANGIIQSREGRIQEKDVDSDSADGFVSRSTASGGEDKGGSDLLSVKGTMQRRDGDAIVSRGFVSGLVSEEETMQDGCIVEDDDWVFWGVATYRHDDSNAVRSLLMATVR